MLAQSLSRSWQTPGATGCAGTGADAPLLEDCSGLGSGVASSAEGSRVGAGGRGSKGSPGTELAAFWPPAGVLVGTGSCVTTGCDNGTLCGAAGEAGVACGLSGEETEGGCTGPDG